MHLDKDLAEQIMTKARAILDRDVLVTDTSGIVLAGEHKQGQIMPEAVKAIQEGRPGISEIDGRQIKWCPFVYEDKTLGSFGIISANGQITPEAISLLQGLSEVIVHQHLLLDRIQSTETIRSSFIKQVLDAPNIEPDEIYHQADILQLDLHSPQAIILANLKSFESNLHAKVSHLSPEEQKLELSRHTDEISRQIRAAFRNFSHNIVAYLGKDNFVVLKGIGGENLNTLNTIRFLREKGQYVHETLSATQHDFEKVTIGVGQYYPDLGGLRKSYQDAKLSLEVGTKVWGTGGVYHIKDVGMFVTLANISQDRKAELAHQILHPLLKDQQLFKTVKKFLESGLNLTEAAEELHIHRNTLIYRLDKTKKLINLDPRHFDDALQIKLGLMFYQPSQPA